MADIEKIKDISITTVAECLGYHVKSIGSRYYTLKEHDSVRIDPVRNMFFRNSTGQCGSVIDFVIAFTGKNTGDAIRYLQGYIDNDTEEKLIRKERAAAMAAAPKDFLLPERADTMKHVFAYLSKTRMIDPEIVRDLIKRGYLYEDVRRNCVFVGYKDGEAAFASVRGTNTYMRFVQDISGSDYSVCFFVDNRSDILTITESGIDAMSVMDLDYIKGRGAFFSDHLALAGCSKYGKAVKRCIKEAGYSQVRIMLDDDDAGRMASYDITKLIRSLSEDIYIKVLFPRTGKDMNDELKVLKSKGEQKNE